MKKRLTVAHYSENLNWLKKINPEIEIFIYHKKNNDINYDNKVILSKNEFELSNVGRESHTYIKHIIDNYENLFDLEFFSQGTPDEYPNFIDIVNNDNILEYKQYSIFPKTFDSFDGKITEHMKNAPEGSYPDTVDIWNNLFSYPPPKHTVIVPHAFIKLNKEKILMHNKEVYLKCLDYFSDNNKNNKYAWSFEYFWALLFSEYHLNFKK